MDNTFAKQSPFSFHYILWWMLTVGLLLASRFPVLTTPVLFGLIPVLFMIMVAREGRVRLYNKAFGYYLALFLWACLSLIYTVNMDLTLDYLQAMLGNVIIWYVANAILERTDNPMYLCIPLFLVFIAHAYFGIVVPVETVNDRVEERAKGLTSNANGLGFLMWYGVVISSFLFLLSRKFLVKVVCVITILLLTFVMLKTGSRKSLLAFMGFFFASVFFGGRKSNFSLLLIIGAVIFVFYDVIYDYIINNTTVGARLTAEAVDRGAGNRLQLVEEGWEFFKSSPVLGVGLGSFSSFSSTGQVAHNDYVEVLAGMGLLALFFYMMIFYLYIKRSLFIRRIGRNTILSRISLGFIVGYLLLGTGRPAFVDPAAILMLAFFYSLVDKEYKREQEEYLYEESLLSQTA